MAEVERADEQCGADRPGERGQTRDAQARDAPDPVVGPGDGRHQAGGHPGHPRTENLVASASGPAGQHEPDREQRRREHQPRQRPEMITEHPLGPRTALWARPGQVQRWGDLSDLDATAVIFPAGVVDPATDALASVEHPSGPRFWRLDDTVWSDVAALVSVLRTSHDAVEGCVLSDARRGASRERWRESPRDGAVDRATSTERLRLTSASPLACAFAPRRRACNVPPSA